MNNTLTEIDKLIEILNEQIKFCEDDNEPLDSCIWGKQHGVLISCNNAKSIVTQLKTVIQGNQDEAMVIKTKYGSVHFETVQSLAESFAGLLKSVKKSLEQRDEKSNPHGSYSEEEGWISVEDKLPDDCCPVLGFTAYKTIEPVCKNPQITDIGYKFVDADTAEFGVSITHWRKLPQPPITKTN